MRKFFSPLCVLIATAFLFSACLSSDEETTYSDTAITSFTLGTLNRYVHTTSSTGTDSVYKATLTGSYYNFYIDQNGRQIYNPDSLPIWTDNSRVVCTIGTKNAGIVVYKSFTSDSCAYYSSTDSIDISKPREFRVYSSDGKAYRKYTIHVNVHQELPDSFIWNKIAVNDIFANLSGMKAIELNGNILLFGSNGSETNIYSTAISDGKQWTAVNSGTAFDADAYKNVITQKGTVFVKSNGNILKSANGTEWNVITSNSEIKQLLGASTTELYATNSSNYILCSRDGGATWTKDSMDESSSLVPTKDISYCCTASNTNDSTDRITIIGNRSETEYPSDSTSFIWNKIVEYSSNASAGVWEYFGKADDNYVVYAPRLNNLNVVEYDSGLLAFGGDGIGASTAKAFSHFYQSRDNGLTWKNNTKYYFPSDFISSKTAFTSVTDSNNNLWIICGNSGQVWRGRLNRLGWNENQKSFVK